MTNPPRVTVSDQLEIAADRPVTLTPAEALALAETLTIKAMCRRAALAPTRSRRALLTPGRARVAL